MAAAYSRRVAGGPPAASRNACTLAQEQGRTVRPVAVHQSENREMARGYAAVSGGAAVWWGGLVMPVACGGISGRR